MYKLIMSINNNEEYIVFPAVPDGIGPEYPQNNDTFQGLSRDYNTIGTMGLWAMSISSFFPVGRRYRFMPPEALTDGWQYVSFFERNRPRKLPFRVILLDDHSICRLNSACTVDSFSWQVKRNGDISYTLQLREYRFVSGVK